MSSALQLGYTNWHGLGGALDRALDSMTEVSCGQRSGPINCVAMLASPASLVRQSQDQSCEVGSARHACWAVMMQATQPSCTASACGDKHPLGSERLAQLGVRGIAGGHAW